MRKRTNEELCALAQKGDAAALDQLIENNASFIGKVANDLYRSANLEQVGLSIDREDLKQAGRMALWKAIPLYDAERGVKFLAYAAAAIRNAMLDMIDRSFHQFEQRMVAESDGLACQRICLDEVLSGEGRMRRIEAIADPYAMQPLQIVEKQETLRELYDGLERISLREQAWLLYRYGFADDLEHTMSESATHFHLTRSRAKKTETLALDDLWLELPW